MGSASVVPPQPAREGAGAVRARGVGAAVGPAAHLAGYCRARCAHPPGSSDISTSSSSSWAATLPPSGQRSHRQGDPRQRARSTSSSSADRVDRRCLPARRFHLPPALAPIAMSCGLNGSVPSDLRARRGASPMTRRGDADALSPLELDRDDQAATPHRTRLPRGSTAGHAAGASTSGPARRSTIFSTRRISSGAPCWGVSGTRSASAPSSRSCSSEATQSRTRRSGTGSAAARRSWRTRSGPSAEAAPGSPGPSMRPT